MSGVLVGRYDYEGAIGKGGFGVVDQYRDAITGESVAIKTVPSVFVNQESRRLVREVDIMCFLHDAHPHLIGYFSMFVTVSPAAGAATIAPAVGTAAAAVANHNDIQLDTHGPLYRSLNVGDQLIMHHNALCAKCAEVKCTDEFNLHIVMPLMKGDLFFFIKLISSHTSQLRLHVTPAFLAQVAVVFAFQISFGLDYLHQCDIIHRDMKPDNVLVRLDVNNPYMSTALIADMGLARDVQESDTSYVCTRYYRPPEIITSVSRSSSKIDMWSLGCIFFEMCTGTTLFLLPSALHNGAWDGGKASVQLEFVLNTIGTPSQADIERYMPPGNAKLYLQRSVPRRSKLADLIRDRWKLTAADAHEQEKWIDLISSCVAFFPEQRPTAEQLCRHQLFQDYNVFYGENVKQFVARHYTPTFGDPARGRRTALQAENKQMVLDLVRHSLSQTQPVLEDEVIEETGPGPVQPDFTAAPYVSAPEAALRNDYGGLDVLLEHDEDGERLLGVEPRHNGYPAVQRYASLPSQSTGSFHGDHGPVLVDTPPQVAPVGGITAAGPVVQSELTFPLLSAVPSSVGLHRTGQSAVGGSAFLPLTSYYNSNANISGRGLNKSAPEGSFFVSRRPEEEYDYVGETLYAAAAADRRRGGASLATSPQSSSLITSPVMQPRSAALPFALDDDLRQRYEPLSQTEDGVRAAVSKILAELNTCTYDSRRSSQLRALLSYFVNQSQAH